ncbi:MAG: YgjV family protein [Alphaproteobacteria bacterium]|nr:YgjV family protein [Alphaproteobacteria bacterium]
MQTYLIVGNIFSLLSAICIAVSAVKKSKTDFMYWQIGDTLFGIVANIALSAYAALVIAIACLIRNILSYKDKLTKNITIFLVIISIIIGLYANNLGAIGWLPIIASASYTICIYITKNDQQMRWSLSINMLLWFVHNLYVQAYPSAIANIILFGWTFLQIYKNRKR